MKNLVIHPKDSSTDFLTSSYTKIKNQSKIVRELKFKKEEYLNLIDQSKKIVLMGHGTYLGLIDPSSNKNLLIDSIDFPEALKKKPKIFIWCNSDEYVHSYFAKFEKPVLYTGMIISDLDEAKIYNIECSNEDILESNFCFAKTLDFLFYEILEQEEISNLTLTKILNDFYNSKNPIIQFNKERIYFNN